jgi:hypothetical protein
MQKNNKMMLNFILIINFLMIACAAHAFGYVGLWVMGIMSLVLYTYAFLCIGRLDKMQASLKSIRNRV